MTSRGVLSGNPADSLSSLYVLAERSAAIQNGKNLRVRRHLPANRTGASPQIAQTRQFFTPVLESFRSRSRRSLFGILRRQILRSRQKSDPGSSNPRDRSTELPARQDFRSSGSFSRPSQVRGWCSRVIRQGAGTSRRFSRYLTLKCGQVSFMSEPAPASDSGTSFCFVQVGRQRGLAPAGVGVFARRRSDSIAFSGPGLPSPDVLKRRAKSIL